jgi:hypothetical protein
LTPQTQKASCTQPAGYGANAVSANDGQGDAGPSIRLHSPWLHLAVNAHGYRRAAPRSRCPLDRFMFPAIEVAATRPGCAWPWPAPVSDAFSFWRCVLPLLRDNVTLAHDVRARFLSRGQRYSRPRVVHDASSPNARKIATSRSPPFPTINRPVGVSNYPADVRRSGRIDFIRQLPSAMTEPVRSVRWFEHAAVCIWALENIGQFG